MSKYILDAKKLCAVLADLPDNESRGEYILVHIIDMAAEPLGKAKLPSWAAKAPKKTSAKDFEGYSQEFEDFWKAYPKKTGKGAAYDAWKKVNGDCFVCDMLAALSWQKRTLDWTKDNGKYIPMPVTYLNQRRWEDEAPIQPKTSMVF